MSIPTRVKALELIEPICCIISMFGAVLRLVTLTTGQAISSTTGESKGSPAEFTTSAPVSLSLVTTR